MADLETMYADMIEAKNQTLEHNALYDIYSFHKLRPFARFYEIESPCFDPHEFRTIGEALQWTEHYYN